MFVVLDVSCGYGGGLLDVLGVYICVGVANLINRRKCMTWS